MYIMWDIRVVSLQYFYDIFYDWFYLDRSIFPFELFVFDVFRFVIDRYAFVFDRCMLWIGVQMVRE